MGATVVIATQTRAELLIGWRHTADRWTAATAIAVGAALLSGDETYHGAPGLRVLAS